VRRMHRFGLSRHGRVGKRSDQYPAAPPLSEAGPDASQDRHLSDADPLRAKIFEVLNDFPVPLTKAVVPILVVELASALNGKDL
jgi:hypothetical protein